MAVVLDSSVVVAFLDRSDSLHGAAERLFADLLPDQRLLVSAITFAEVLTGARLGHHDESIVRGFFAELISAVLPVDFEVADRAAALRARTPSLRMPDALIAAGADLEAEAEILYSADRGLAGLRGLSCQTRLLAA